MDPGTWIAIISAVVGAIAAESSADAQASAAQGQANIAANQATVARMSATNALQAGNANEEAQSRKSDLLLGQQRAGLLAAGIGTSGTAVDVYGQNVGTEMLKALDARYDGQLKSWSLLNQANVGDAQSQLDLNNADAAETAGTFGAATSLLKGASATVPAKGADAGGVTKGTTSAGGTSISIVSPQQAPQDYQTQYS
jgi:hypothetical protein